MIVFIIGSGRCGTNMVGELLASNKEWNVDIEQQPQFGLGTQLATQVWNPHTFHDLISIYKEKSSQYQNYADKIHPNLWIAEELQEIFPEAKFIYCKRNVTDVVKSMEKHHGVNTWYDKPDNPQLRRFLGKGIAELDKYAKRLLAHDMEYDRIKDRINSHVFDYDAAQQDPAKEVRKLENYLGYLFNHNIIKKK